MMDMARALSMLGGRGFGGQGYQQPQQRGMGMPNRGVPGVQPPRSPPGGLDHTMGGDGMLRSAVMPPGWQEGMDHSAVQPPGWQEGGGLDHTMGVGGMTNPNGPAPQVAQIGPDGGMSIGHGSMGTSMPWGVQAGDGMQMGAPAPVPGMTFGGGNSAFGGGAGQTSGGSGFGGGGGMGLGGGATRAKTPFSAGRSMIGGGSMR